MLALKIQQFISEHLDSDLNKLLLQKSPVEGYSMPFIVEQIKGRKISARKYPFLRDYPQYLFPSSLSLEQSSSEATARYKARNLFGETFADLTAGMGIDAYFLSLNFQRIFLVEQNAELCAILRHNFKVLEREVEVVKGDLNSFLSTVEKPLDFIYLDPARRDQNKRKVFLLEDLSPNLLLLEQQLVDKAHRILVKLSPMIDLKYLVATLHYVRSIEVVAVRNEVKEILVHLSKEEEKETVPVTAVNLESTEPDFTFDLKDLSVGSAVYSPVRNYLYIPNNAVLKTGAFHGIALKFGLYKLHPNTHLYTSDEPIEGFPGRRLQVEQVPAKTLKKGDRYQIISRNHPLSPEQIKKKYKVGDGGHSYLIFTQDVSGKIVLKSL